MRAFKNPAALITGAENGFGREFAVEACNRGMKLFLVGTDEPDVNRTVQQIPKMSRTAQACCRRCFAGGRCGAHGQ